jgi:hypothetical protein
MKNKRENNICDQGASELGLGISLIKDLSNLQLNLQYEFKKYK